MKTAKFRYKCRLCGEIYTDACASKKTALMVLIRVVSEQFISKKPIGIQSPFPESNPLIPRLIDIHSGCKAGLGVSDLIGYIVEDGKS
ncbi:hypothetical protein KA005_74495 [bacterium]|nr:hypothetical protein [bacterium]